MYIWFYTIKDAKFCKVYSTQKDGYNVHILIRLGYDILSWLIFIYIILINTYLLIYLNEVPTTLTRELIHLMTS